MFAILLILFVCALPMILFLGGAGLVGSYLGQTLLERVQARVEGAEGEDA